ncbi:MAG TPA: PLP-dependent transferase, partial [Actinomycetota bacterium]|nr:PLP-dependent transferase [Actinomycetota bacterium]
TSSGFESWLAMRGLATLGLRVERHCSNALAVATFLEAQPSVSRVLYPGLASHPQHERASKLLTGYGGMVAVDLGSQEGAWRFMDGTQVARVGSSFGGVRSELTHPASTSHRQFSTDDRLTAGITDGLVRIAVGLEDIDDLLADFDGALR